MLLKTQTYVLEEDSPCMLGQWRVAEERGAWCWKLCTLRQGPGGLGKDMAELAAFLAWIGEGGGMYVSSSAPSSGRFFLPGFC